MWGGGQEKNHPVYFTETKLLVQDGGCSNNLELIEDHTNSLVAVEAVRVVLHQFEPVKPYFLLVLAQSEAWSYPRRDFQLGLSIRGRPVGLLLNLVFLSPAPPKPCFPQPGSS